MNECEWFIQTALTLFFLAACLACCVSWEILLMRLIFSYFILFYFFWIWFRIWINKSNNNTQQTDDSILREVFFSLLQTAFLCASLQVCLYIFFEIKFIKSGSTSENSLFEYVKIIFALSPLLSCITIALLLWFVVHRRHRLSTSRSWYVLTLLCRKFFSVREWSAVKTTIFFRKFIP